MAERNRIGEAIRSAREAKGWSQSDLARRLKLKGQNPEATVSHYETGRRVPGLKNMVAFAKALGLSIDRIVGLDDHAPERRLGAPDRRVPRPEGEGER